MTYLVDTSAVVRMRRGQEIRPIWFDRLRAGELAVCPPVEAELLYGATGKADRDRLQTFLRELFAWQPVPDSAWTYIANLQNRHFDKGLHKAPTVVDLLVAATAHAWGLTVLHVDKDFDAIAETAGIRTIRADIETI